MALNFDGTNDFVTCGDIDAIDNATSLTVAAWVNLDTVTADNYVVENADAFNGGGFIFFRDESSGGSGRTNVWRITVYDSADASTADLESDNNSANTTGSWIHLAFTFTANSATGLRLYVDGQEVSDSPVDVSSVGAIDSGAGTFTVGINSFSGTAGFDGKMTEVAAWDAVLTAAEISDLYTSKVKGMPVQIQSSNLQVYLPLDDHPNNDTANSANTLVFRDASGNSNDGTAGGCNSQAEEVLSYQIDAILADIIAEAAGGVTITPSAIEATALIQSPTITTVRNVTITPSAISATAKIETVTATATETITLTPATQQAQTLIQAPIIQTAGNVTVITAVQEAQTIINAPTISAGQSIVISPAVQEAQTIINAVTVDIQTGTTILPDVITANMIIQSATIRVPGVLSDVYELYQTGIDQDNYKASAIEQDNYMGSQIVTTLNLTSRVKNG